MGNTMQVIFSDRRLEPEESMQCPSHNYSNYARLLVRFQNFDKLIVP